ncbi:MAG: DUF2162 domain-containing protein [Nitrospirota bacterium]
MNLAIILWAFGMLFTLSIFSLKVGVGLGYGSVGVKGICLTLAGYAGMFVLLALVSDRLIPVLTPLLQNGPYLHAFIAAGMIVWGIVTLQGSHTRHRDKHRNGRSLVQPSLLLIVPCPVCVTAITFSTWVALSVIQLPAAIVGLGLGATFSLLSFLFVVITRFKKSTTPEIGLGFSMIAIGLYFIASLYLPQKIEEAKAVYCSFLDAGDMSVSVQHEWGVPIILFTAMVIGYFSKLRKETA